MSAAVPTEAARTTLPSKLMWIVGPRFIGTCDIARRHARYIERMERKRTTAHRCRRRIGALEQRKGEREMEDYDERAFNDALNENMADDPYGTAMYLIREAVKGAQSYNGTMNEHEALIIETIRRVMLLADPHLFGADSP